MALAIGKRKRRQDVSNDRNADANDSDDDAAARALFQRAFEKKFKPLEKTEKSKEEAEPNADSEDDEEEESDVASNSGSDSSDASDAFSGFSATSSSDDEQNPKPQIEVITDSTPRQTRDRASEKLLKRQFMSAKPPSTSSTPSYPIPHKPSTTAASAAAQPDDDASDIQNDLALQRLLKESHLLDASTFSASGSASSAPEGSARQRALDMRIRDLGGKKSHLAQEKMPLAMRRGMAAKAAGREGKRRAEARESGVVLERFGGKGAAGAGGSGGGGAKERPKAKRAIGTGGPGVGTFRGATLRLSKSDVRGIEGGGGRGGKGGGRGGKKRKGGMNFGSGF
ncbi:hypothetical protein WHR41_00738 [Cladosporium halotolerans]|uniref:Uncharacterized protein n=1 Tax=Cladosporium halotolerans TaxID=1052096 RepID=A0AB34L0Z8_9PEZI